MTTEMTSPTVIPAQPGWFVLSPSMQEGADSYDEFVRDPVVAWLVEVYAPKDKWGRHTTCTYPVGIESLPDDCPMQGPDGRIVFCENCSFDNEADALAYANSRRDRSRAA